MQLNRIALTGFRNYEFETVEFKSGVNIISGKNAQGKTNLLESVCLLFPVESRQTDSSRFVFPCAFFPDMILTPLLNSTVSNS